MATGSQYTKKGNCPDTSPIPYEKLMKLSKPTNPEHSLFSDTRDTQRAAMENEEKMRSNHLKLRKMSSPQKQVYHLPLTVISSMQKNSQQNYELKDSPSNTILSSIPKY